MSLMVKGFSVVDLMVFLVFSFMNLILYWDYSPQVHEDGRQSCIIVVLNGQSLDDNPQVHEECVA